MKKKEEIYPSLVALALGRGSSCDDKKKFTRADLAREVAKKSSQIYRKSMSYYRCPFCTAYHVGSEIEKAFMREKVKEALSDIECSETDPEMIWGKMRLSVLEDEGA